MGFEQPDSENQEALRQKAIGQLREMDQRMREEIATSTNRDPNFLGARNRERLLVDDLRGELEETGNTPEVVLQRLEDEAARQDEILNTDDYPPETKEGAAIEKEAIEKRIEILKGLNL